MAKGDERVGKLVKCSFCGKPQDQVRRIVAGPGVYICDECVQPLSGDSGRGYRFPQSYGKHCELPKPARD